MPTGLRGGDGTAPSRAVADSRARPRSEGRHRRLITADVVPEVSEVSEDNRRSSKQASQGHVPNVCHDHAHSQLPLHSHRRGTPQQNHRHDVCKQVLDRGAMTNGGSQSGSQTRRTHSRSAGRFRPVNLTITPQLRQGGRFQTRGHELRIRRLGVRIPPGAQDTFAECLDSEDMTGPASANGQLVPFALVGGPFRAENGGPGAR